MNIDKTDEYLRDNLENIMKGEWDNHFDESQLEMARKESFMLNHISIGESNITFEYGSEKIIYSFNSDPLDFHMHGGDFKMHMLSMIKSDEAFLKSYKSFLRDWKIGKIIE